MTFAEWERARADPKFFERYAKVVYRSLHKKRALYPSWDDLPDDAKQYFREYGLLLALRRVEDIDIPEVMVQAAPYLRACRKEYHLALS